MDDNALAALKAAYEASTRGEWRIREEEQHPLIVNDDRAIAALHILKGGVDAAKADAAFIVAAHAHVPALLAEVERLRQHVSLFTQVVGERELRAVNAAIDVWETSRIKPTDAP